MSQGTKRHCSAPIPWVLVHGLAVVDHGGGSQFRGDDGCGDTLLPASATENLDVQPQVREEDEELDADKVFAKLSSLKGRNQDEDEQ